MFSFLHHCASWNPEDSLCIDTKLRARDLSPKTKEKLKEKILKRMLPWTSVQRGRDKVCVVFWKRNREGELPLFLMVLFLILLNDGASWQRVLCRSSYSDVLSGKLRNDSVVFLIQLCSSLDPISMVLHLREKGCRFSRISSTTPKSTPSSYPRSVWHARWWWGPSNPKAYGWGAVNWCLLKEHHLSVFISTCLGSRRNRYRNLCIVYNL